MKDEFDREIDRLSGLQNAAEGELRDYQKRLKQLTAIKKDIDRDFTNNIDDINKKMNKTIQMGSSGIRRSAYTEVNCVYQSGEDIRKSAPGLASDNFAEIRRNMSNEISRVEAKIDSLESQIASYEAQISSTREAKKDSK